MIYIGLEDIKSNSVSNWLEKREHVIGCTLTCTTSKNTSLNIQTFSGNKERAQKTL